MGSIFKKLDFKSKVFSSLLVFLILYYFPVLIMLLAGIIIGCLFLKLTMPLILFLLNKVKFQIYNLYLVDKNILLFMLLPIALVLILFFSTLFILLIPKSKNALKNFKVSEKAMTSILIKDSSNRIVSTISRDLNKLYVEEEGKPYRTPGVFVNYIPETLFKALVFREHRELDFKKNSIKSMYGINVLSMAIKPLISLGKNGGSSLINQLTKKLYEVESKETFSDKIKRKVHEIETARDLFDYLADNNGSEFKRVLLQNASFISGVYSIFDSGYLLFGKKHLTDLTEAEQLIFSVMYKYNYNIFTQKSNRKMYLKAQWSKIKKNAIFVAKNIFKNNPMKYLEVKNKISKMKAPLFPYVDNELKFIEKLKLKSLYYRTSVLLKTLVTDIQKEIKMLKLNNNEVITETKLTVDIISNSRFQKRIEEIINKNNLDEIDFRIKIWNAQNGDIKLFFKKGAYIENKILQIGSIAKLVGLYYLIVEKDFSANKKACNKWYYGRSNPPANKIYIVKKGVPAKKCKYRGNSISLRATIGYSLNLVFRSFLVKSKITKAELLELYKKFALKFPNQRTKRTITKADLINGIVFGSAKAQSSNIDKLIHAITSSLYLENTSIKPHLVKNITVSELLPDHNRKVSTRTVNSSNDLALKLNYLNYKTRFLNVITGVYDFGTLSPFKNLFKKYENITFIWGKTGTSTTNFHADKYRFAVGSFKINEIIYNFTFIIGADKGIRKIRIFTPIMKEIIKYL